MMQCARSCCKPYQAAPTGLSATTPTTLSDNNGYISGTTTAMEYKLSSAGSYTTCMAGATTGLSHGDYVVRYAAKAGYDASATTPVTVLKQSQSAPTGLTGVAPTTVDNNDGKISGTTPAMEYILQSSYPGAFTACTGLLRISLTTAMRRMDQFGRNRAVTMKDTPIQPTTLIV